MKRAALALLFFLAGCGHVRHVRLSGAVYKFAADCEQPCTFWRLRATVVDGVCVCEGEK